MAKMEYFRDLYGNAATIKAESGGTLYRLICRDYNGKKWKHSYHISAKAAKAALHRTGPGWKTVKGKVTAP